jgi:hypothetical protein
MPAKKDLSSTRKVTALLKESNQGANIVPKKSPGAIKFKIIEKDILSPDIKDLPRFIQQAIETTGSDDTDFLEVFFSQVGSIHPDINSNPIKFANFTSAFIHGLKPSDQLEAILFAQMAGNHNLIMEFMRRAIRKEQLLEAAGEYTDRVSKLMGLFIRQLEALEKYRGKSFQQKVIVEHVYVGEGGKAIVGNVGGPTRGEGGKKKNED